MSFFPELKRGQFKRAAFPAGNFDAIGLIIFLAGGQSGRFNSCQILKTIAMLFQQLDRIRTIVQHYDNQEGWSVFLEEAIRHQPPGLGTLIAAATGSPSRIVEMTKLAVGAHLYQKLIAPLPAIMTVLQDILEAREFSAYLRCGLASALAYLVSSDDILPERRKGTPLQLVDDSLIIHYSYHRFLRDVSPQISVSGDMLERYYGDIASVMKAGFNIFPPGRVGEMRKALATVAIGFSSLREVPDHLLEKIIDQIIAHPGEHKPEKLLVKFAHHLGIGILNYDPGVLYDPLLQDLGISPRITGTRPGSRMPAGDLYY